MNVEETETLAFTYDRPFHMSQIHIKSSTDQTELKLWLMTEPSEILLISHQHSAILVLLKYLILFHLKIVRG